MLPNAIQLWSLTFVSFFGIIHPKSRNQFSYLENKEQDQFIWKCVIAGIIRGQEQHVKLF